MKKSLFALAAMGAFVGAAHAQSSVTVSGLLEVGYTSKSIRAVGEAAGAEVAQSGITGGHFGTPVLRVEGTEDLGGGTTAGFAIRDEFNVGTGARTSSLGVFTETFVSLTNKSLGSLSAGRMYPASRDLGGVYRFMGDIGRINVNLNSGVNSNTIQYVTPSLQGFSASAAYTNSGKSVLTVAPLNVDQNKEPLSQIAVGLRGTIGKASLAASMESQKIAAATAGADQATNTITSVGGSYDFGVAKLGVAYFDQKHTLAGGADGGKRNAYTINLAAPVTKVITLGASFANYEVSPAAGGDKPKATIMTVGAQYALSKRTSIYASYQQVTNSGANDALKSTSADGITSGTSNGSSRGLGVSEINGGTGRGFGLTAVHTF
jgi:GBP family porin